MKIPRPLRFLGGVLLGTAATVALFALTNRATPPATRTDQEADISDNDEEDPGQDSSQDGLSTLNTPYFHLAGLTHPGKRRPNNQDSFKFGPLDDNYALAIVCDGMGGHAGGEVAASIATEVIWTVISKLAKDSDPETIHEVMTEAIKRADAAIELRASKDSSLHGMGTTAAIAAISRDDYLHCYLGDSRLYHIRQDEIVYQTKDHSVVRFLLEEGIINTDEVKEHPYRSQLTSSLGGGPKANRLTIEPKWGGDPADAAQREWRSGDWLLLCSDGLNSELEDQEIASIVSGTSTPSEALNALQQKVLETEARDNVTMIIARKL